MLAWLLVMALMVANANILALADTLILPSSVKVIDNEAFMGDDSIDEVVLPEGIEKIGERAFADSALSAINLPESLRQIGDDALDGPDKVRVTASKGSYAYDWAEEKGYLGKALMESPHPYASDSDETWSYNHPDTVYALKIVFSDETELEDDYDTIEITSEYGQRKTYTGQELSGQSITVLGSRFELRLCSDSSEEFYGFSIVEIEGLSRQEYNEQIASPIEDFVIENGVVVKYTGPGGDVVIPSVDADGNDITKIGDYAFSKVNKDNYKKMQYMILSPWQIFGQILQA